MIKAIEFPGKEFATKEDVFKALWLNKDKIISLKKSTIYKGAEKGQFNCLNAEKAIKAVNKASFEPKADCIYPIISTTNYMDSHEDVHFNGCFNKTISDQQGRIKYVLDHIIEYDKVIAWEKDVTMFKAAIDWALVGKNYAGVTEGLVFEIKKESIKRQDVLKDIEDGKSDFENSIRMTYITIRLGMDSQDPEHKEAKAYYDSRYKEIVNKDVVDNTGYFWGVEELRILKEGSLVTAGGSNDATSIYHKNTFEAGDTTSDGEPGDTTRKSQVMDFKAMAKEILNNNKN